MKKILAILAFILLFLGMREESYAKDEYDPYTDGKVKDVEINYDYLYENNTSNIISFKGYIIHQTISFDEYKHFYCYGDFNNDIYLILTRTGNVKEMYQKSEIDFRILKVRERESISFDGYDASLEEYPYNYISVATYEEFDVDAFSSYSKRILINADVFFTKEIFYFGKPAKQNVSIDYRYNPITDGQIIMGLLCIYDYEIKYCGEYDYLDYGMNNLTYIIKASNGEVLERNLEINYIYDTKPVFSAIKTRIPVDVNNPKSVRDIINQNFSAYDEIDGDLTRRIHYETLYDALNPVVGEYELLLEVEDLEGYVSNFSAIIVVFDSLGIVANYNIKTSYEKELTYDEILELAKMEDGASYIVIDENYTDYYQGIGEYYFISEITNIYGMTFPIEISINVVDDVCPIITTSSITTTTSTIISDDDIISNLVINEYSSYEIKIDKSEYIPDIIGSYKVYVEVFDLYGNSSKNELYINVTVDNKINYYNHTIRAYTDYALSENEVIAFLRDISNNQYDSTCESSIESDYFNNPLSPGSYSATLVTRLASGVEIREDYIIDVKEVYVEKKKKKKNIFWRIILAIKKIFLSIIRFFRKLFEFIFK